MLFEGQKFFCLLTVFQIDLSVAFSFCTYSCFSMTTLNPPTTNPTSEPQNCSVDHSRNLSIVSSVTLHANTSSHSISHEPLLPPISQSSLGACDVISQSRLSPIFSHPRWSQNVRQSSSRDQKITNTPNQPDSQSQRFRWLKIGLETVMGVC